MYKKILGVFALAFSLILCPTVFAHNACGEGMKQMLGSLKLDDAQKEKIKPILESMKSTMQQSGDQMRDLNKQINDQAISPNMDQSAVSALVDKKTKLLGDMIKAKVSAKNQIYAVLNDEQKTQLQGMMKKMEDKMAEKFKSCHDEE